MARGRQLTFTAALRKSMISCQGRYLCCAVDLGVRPRNRGTAGSKLCRKPAAHSCYQIRETIRTNQFKRTLTGSATRGKLPRKAPRTGGCRSFHLCESRLCSVLTVCGAPVGREKELVWPQLMGRSTQRFSIEDEGCVSGRELATGGRAHLKWADCRRTARFIIEVSVWLELGGVWAKLKRNEGSLNRPKAKAPAGATKQTCHVPPCLHTQDARSPRPDTGNL